MVEINQEEVNNIIAKNLIALRKRNGLTQLQLAEEMNYSDKAISKWEKGDCVPSIYVLMALAKYYEVDIKDILCERATPPTPKKGSKNIKLIWSFLSCAIVLLVATISFLVTFYAFNATDSELCFIVALPIAALVNTILFSTWHWRIRTGIAASLFVWLSIFAISLILKTYNIWLIYLVGIPLQVMIILFLLLSHLKNKNKL